MKVTLVKTNEDHFVTFSSFLHGIMALAGYGRALLYASAPLQGEEMSEDKHQISNAVEEQIIKIHDQALQHGFVPPVKEKWIPTCISYWKVNALIATKKSNIELLY